MQQTCIFLANMNMNDDDHDEYIQSATYNFHIGSVDSFHINCEFCALYFEMYGNLCMNLIGRNLVVYHPKWVQKG